MAFSAGIKLSGLDDFIAPSQACIKPVESLPAARAARGIIHVEGSVEALVPAKITLNDCLACSGCITSAESVLITQQSVGELMSWLAANKEAGGSKALVVSLSPQCWASVAAHFAIPPTEAAGRIVGMLKALGAALVVDVALARDLSLHESCAEYVGRVHQGGERTLLASACPGWVCYAEKTQHSAIPHISTVKSPQQITGSLLKRHAAKLLGRDPSEVYHLALMPCFDKKLEASRDDFTLPSNAELREVDLVLTSAEILDLLSAASLHFLSIPPSPLDPMPLVPGIPGGPLTSPDGRAWGVGGVSGSFAEEVFRHAAEGLFGRRVRVRNSDFHELVLQAPLGTPGSAPAGALLKVARCFGFRNIQNIVRQLRTSKGCAYSYVEVMACPAGCVNGGGQIRVAENSGESPKDRLKQVKESFKAGQVPRRPGENPELQTVYEQVVGAPPNSEGARVWLHTQYTARTDELINPIAIQW